MSDRSAVSTIKGYFYQFDLSIYKILTLTNSLDCVDIECIEDIDIQTATETTAIQCKYYQDSEYNHSIIKKPIQLMLKHFVESKKGVSGKKINYLLYGYYESGQGKMPDQITIDFLKENFLTYKKEGIKHFYYNEVGACDDDLQEFIGVLKIDINAHEFESQRESIKGELKTIFGCDDRIADIFYYNNALRVLHDISIQHNDSDRRITKKSFLEKINTRKILFNSWYVEWKGKEKFFKEIKNEYFAKLNIYAYERFFLIEIKKDQYVRSILKTLIIEVSRKFSKVSIRDPRRVCPYFFINGIDDDELTELKRELSVEGFKFTDGYNFRGADFDVASITREPEKNNPVKIKIIDSKIDLEKTIMAINSVTREVYQFYINDVYFDFDNPSVAHTKIQVSSLEDISKITLR